jgi:hypothetical protein
MQYIKGLPPGPDENSAKPSSETRPAPEVKSAPEVKRGPEVKSAAEVKWPSEPKPAYESKPAYEAKPAKPIPEEKPFEVPMAEPKPVSKGKGNKKIKRLLPLTLIAMGVVTGGFLWRHKPTPSNSSALAVQAVQAEPLHRNDVSQPLAKPPETPAATLPAPSVTPVSIEPGRLTPPATPAPTETPVAAPNVATANDRSTARGSVNPPAAMGTLAVSSPIAAEIYSEGKYLASTPTTLKLPAGKHTLEYRHGELRTVASYDIKPNETVAAPVTFQIPVQINAKPWAQVFLDGLSRQPLGQTPLTGTSVPIGGVLVFEHPDFPSKRYRISDKDTAIQINFP